MLITMQNLAKSFGAEIVLTNVNAVIQREDRIGMIGENGAGKTTLLMHLLGQKPEHEVWAVLMNEFGQIGVDQQLMPKTEGYAVKELLG
ncbi:MAG: GTP-binding protein, partial [Oscillospiraceae bacterium]